MSGVLISVNINDKEVRTLLTGIQSRLGNLTPAMKIVGEIVLRSVKENFRQGGRPEKWKLTKGISRMSAYGGGAGSMAGDENIKGIKYRKGKKVLTKRGDATKGFERYASGKKTLIETKRLMNSLTYKAETDKVTVGTNVIYGAIHQFGGPAGRGRKVNIPARPYLMVQNEDWPDIKETLTDYLTRKGA